jgi:hypothetical protein
MKKLFGVATCALLLSCATAFGQQFGPWSAPVNLGAVVNSACNDMHPTLSKDGLTLIFSSTRLSNQASWFNPVSCQPASNLRLWVSHFDKTKHGWGTPIPLSSVLQSPNEDIYGSDNQYAEDHAPNLTTDGHWLFFHSQRPGDLNHPSCNGGGYRELWAAHRQDTRSDDWEAPINLGCTLNISYADDAGPNLWEEDDTGTLYLYFTRDLLPNGAGSDPAGQGFDIYVSICTSDLSSCIRQQLWSVAERVSLLNSSARDTRTALRHRDGLEMIITSGRCNSPIPPADSGLCTNNQSVGGLDLWVSTRPLIDGLQDNWLFPPVNLNDDNLTKCAALGIAATACPVVNTSANDAAPALSWDGQMMVFWSNRGGGFSGNDLYMSTRPKITGCRRESPRSALGRPFQDGRPSGS